MYEEGAVASICISQPQPAYVETVANFVGWKRKGAVMRTQVVSLKEAARELGVNYDAVYHHFRAGRIPAKKVGTVLLVEVPVVKAVLDNLGYTPRQKGARAE
jgi:hypothetical protein